ncbi:ABC-2 type transport system ATP-binding protein/energy-coupling factor transport system ATP-binding protein [Seinonella peptonophila]|uniref:ABC-2 type transport system ATP-binding protein/energy-coupling factor transport system ATP-binding protein n=1 Tax=Seinonella peptonophila TaxID=112248 RepID=A0A1M5AJI6_9BACL|nr:ATP-binding cassette domain-containing protein [Seinonella peptonophila]SHF30480.1 ABC-2 type transport system ATP-binding protein/energy-coupling factor transport system ATP-binding protein [Seinonella peptonophila]
MWIHWSHVSKQYGQQEGQKSLKQMKKPSSYGLLDFSAQVRQGITVILGPEGSGKSTLLKVTAAVMLPDDGRITYRFQSDQHYVWSRGSVIASGTSGLGDLKEKIGYVPDIEHVKHHTTCEESLIHLAQLHRLSRPRARVRKMLAKWGLAAFRKRPLADLPVSELKRYLIVQSLLVQPQFWILDEPTRGLDDYGRQLLIHELKSLDRKRIVLLSTQDMELAECADEMILLEYGSCRRMGKRNLLTASVSEGTVAAWYKAMQTFTRATEQ